MCRARGGVTSAVHYTEKEVSKMKRVWKFRVFRVRRICSSGEGAHWPAPFYTTRGLGLALSKTQLWKFQ